jgi:hypothetical protein
MQTDAVAICDRTKSGLLAPGECGGPSGSDNFQLWGYKFNL